jgi:esterase/lipase superfamily enzyme
MRPRFAVSRVLASALWALLAAAFAGCTNPALKPLELMPTPAAYETAPAPFGAEPASTSDTDAAALEMLFATNRAPAPPETSASRYGGDRGYVLRLGAADIAFGESDIDWARAREISLLKNRPGHFPLHVADVEEFGILPDSVSAFTPHELADATDGRAATEFVARVERQLARSPVKDVFIYVHGYKVTFENPLMVASELWHFMGYEGAFVAFSWPSTPARLAYLKDIETARLSAQALRTLIEFVARETSARRIHVVGYSAGTRLVLASLYESALIHQQSDDDSIRRTTKLGHVILVGSDVDTDVFASYVIDGLLRVPEHLTFYTSPADKALHLSSRIFSHVRMGQILPGMLDVRMREFVAASERLSLVDVEGAANFDAGNGHAYFRQSPWVSSDVLMSLRYGLDPATRGLEQQPPSPIWRFPADYLTRSERALRAANPALTGQPPADAP